MKHLMILAAMLLALAACSKEEQPETVAPAAATTAEPAPETATEAAPANETAAKTQEVVEESAAEAEPEDEAIVLAVADDPAAGHEWKYKEGKNYTRLVPAQMTVGGDADKIEVAEAFMYSCPHCFNLEPHMQKWLATKDPGVRFVRLPVMFNRLAQLHAKIYYTKELLGRNGVLADPDAFHSAVFDEIHRRGNHLTSEAAIQKLFERFGVSAEDFDKAWNSFPVDQKMRVAMDLARRYNINSVPTIIVNGKYITSVAEAGGFDELFELIDELTVREGLR